MTLEEIRERVGGTVAVDVEGASAGSCYVGDLLSDIMGHAGEGCALVTIQNHLNTIAVCTSSPKRQASPARRAHSAIAGQFRALW